MRVIILAFICVSTRSIETGSWVPQDEGLLHIKILSCFRIMWQWCPIHVLAKLVMFNAKRRVLVLVVHMRLEE